MKAEVVFPWKVVYRYQKEQLGYSALNYLILFPLIKENLSILNKSFKTHETVQIVIYLLVNYPF